MKSDSLTILTRKTILVISPQSWGAMFLSKHHYAVELAKAGNTVYFLNPPEETLKSSIIISDANSTKGLHIIQHKLFFPYSLKFHAIKVFHFLMKLHIKRILRKISSPIDIIWSFDIGNLYPFSFFPADSIKIFHPVDEPLNKAAFESAKGAQVIFSVTHEILDKYKNFHIPRIFINHGISEIFLHHSVNNLLTAHHNIRVGWSGNLLRQDIDREIFLEIIRENPKVEFNLWGSYRANESNIAGNINDSSTSNFINALEKMDNVVLHGAVHYAQLAGFFQEMDAFLICYDVEKDQSKGTNYHKIMEYLSTGKVIISNNVTTYMGNPQLISMVSERKHNKALPALFNSIIQNLHKFNDTALQKIRRDYASQNTYSIHINRIDDELSGIFTPMKKTIT